MQTADGQSPDHYLVEIALPNSQSSKGRYLPSYQQEFVERMATLISGIKDQYPDVQVVEEKAGIGVIHVRGFETSIAKLLKEIGGKALSTINIGNLEKTKGTAGNTVARELVTPCLP